MMDINISSKNNIEQFVKDNIRVFNEKGDLFSLKKLKEKFGEDEEFPYIKTDMEEYLTDKFKAFIANEENKTELSLKFDSIISSTKKEIEIELLNIANEYYFSKNDLNAFYKNYILIKFQKFYVESKKYKKNIIDTIISIDKYDGTELSKNEKNYIKNELIKKIDDLIFLALRNGFTRKLSSANTGVTTANEGDSAQFLFVARSMLAGFNCSNVDLRSSRYDAIIDINNRMLRVQVKGISGNGNLPLKDRDRGGTGIDPTSPRNKGKPISSEDCDLYVAVKKDTGICYIIPTTVVDGFVDREIYSVALSKFEEYKENWDIIFEVAKEIGNVRGN